MGTADVGVGHLPSIQTFYELIYETLFDLWTGW